MTPDLPITTKALIRTDLCAYLRERHETACITLTPTKTEAYEKLCVVVFSIPLTSSFVESLFSKMAYNQHKTRSQLSDSTMSSILHVHDAVVPDPQKRLPSTLTLKVMQPTSIRDRMQMNKHIGTRVCQLFDDNLFHGEVVEVRFHDIHAQYMYHVVYTDGDECDYWRHELEDVRCTCRNPPTSDSDSDS